MKKKVPATLLILLFTTIAIYALLSYQEKQQFIQTCSEHQTNDLRLRQALRANDPAGCDALPSPYKNRCTAFITNNPLACATGDRDCIAIAQKRPESCVEPVCRAMASGNISHCALLDAGQAWCERLVRNEPEPGIPNGCELIAKTI
ncbi:hypothetical protein C4580_06415 [Candidatus Woesearchaeota archaeon]|nr:MAG: hypothetical protein C4580_06415 [Candidatus Woesearchaeota archaeon]